MCQGRTMDKVHINLGDKKNKYGLNLVALTRCKNFTDIKIDNFLRD